MSSQLSQTDLNSHICIRGDVAVHPNVAIAPGVILQAEPGSRLVIGQGVCIGLGAILHAYQGVLEIEEGANLGSGVLVVGQGTIGAYACIGSASTIFNHSVEAKQTIGSHCLVGEMGRQVPLEKEVQASPSSPEAIADSSPAQVRFVAAQVSEVSMLEVSAPTASEDPWETTSSTDDRQIYGKAYLNQLLSTLLPHRQPLNSPKENQGKDHNSS